MQPSPWGLYPVWFKLQAVKAFRVGYYLPGDGSTGQLCVFAMPSTQSTYRTVLLLRKHLDWGGMTGSPTHGGNCRETKRGVSAGAGGTPALTLNPRTVLHVPCSQAPLLPAKLTLCLRLLLLAACLISAAIQEFSQVLLASILTVSFLDASILHFTDAHSLHWGQNRRPLDGELSYYYG